MIYNINSKILNVKKIRWGCDFKTADNICCFNRHYAGKLYTYYKIYCLFTSIFLFAYILIMSTIFYYTLLYQKKNFFLFFLNYFACFVLLLYLVYSFIFINNIFFYHIL